MPDNNQATQPQAAQEGKEEKQKTPPLLENLVNESYSAIKGARDFLITGSAIGAATYFYNLVPGFLFSTTPALAAKISNSLSGKPNKIEENRDEVLAGTAALPIVYALVQYIRQIPKAFGLDDIVTNISGSYVPLASSLAVSALSFTALMPAITALRMGFRYVIKEKKISGLYNHYKENYLKRVKERLPAKIAISSLIGASYAVPATFPIVFPALALYGLYSQVQRNLKEKIKEDGKINYKKLLYPSTYIPNFANPFHLVSGFATYGSKLYDKFTSGAYKAASGLRDWWDKSAPPATSQTATAGSRA